MVHLSGLASPSHRAPQGSPTLIPTTSRSVGSSATRHASPRLRAKSRSVSTCCRWPLAPHRLPSCLPFHSLHCAARRPGRTSSLPFSAAFHHRLSPLPFVAASCRCLLSRAFRRCFSFGARDVGGQIALVGAATQQGPSANRNLRTCESAKRSLRTCEHGASNPSPPFRATWSLQRSGTAPPGVARYPFPNREPFACCFSMPATAICARRKVHGWTPAFVGRARNWRCAVGASSPTSGLQQLSPPPVPCSQR
eukprot:7382013-Prymnesium_polylepis.2